jgi:signal transduction histidine kinase
LITENKLKEAKKIIDQIVPTVKKMNSQNTNILFNSIWLDYKIKNNEKIDTDLLVKKVIPYLIDNENYQKLLVYYTVLKENAINNQDYKVALLYEEKLNDANNMLGKNLNSNKVIELDKKYQTQKKEQQIVIQEKTIATKNAIIAWLAFLFLMLFTIIFIYRNKQKQKQIELDSINIQRYTKQLLEKIEEERKRIASDLHDSISHELLEFKNVANGNLEETNIKIDGIINDIRSISRNLHPIMFDKIGLKASVEQLMERAQVANNFMVTADVDYKSSLSSSDELQVYRIIQEALSNIIKYADAVAAKILVTEKEKTIYIEIKDNGKGFNVKKTLNSSDAFGLHNIIERSRAIGGKAKIKSDGNGTIVSIIINKMK